ncbi:MAG: hypothetical protein BRC25_03395 [Parcubacteria group bacterium SW_6_46_9]|nr:MAG: hypothetical protein BRC25_03395 [Parcubacteria group bacterium SW_6_46_9]
MNNTSVVVSVLLIVLVTIGLVVWGTGDQVKDGESMQATTTEKATSSTSERDSWIDSEFAGIKFSHPPEASVSTEAGRAKVQILGPNNEPNTEVTDGITGYLQAVEKEASGLADTAERVFADRSSTPQQVIASTSPATFAGKTGYSFRLQNMLGSETVYYVLPTEQSGLSLVANFTVSGPNSAEFIDQFETITKTAQLQNGAGAEAGNENDNRQPDDNQQADQSSKTAVQACRDAGGDWLSQYNECEGVRKVWCESRGGTYNSCASACRHDPDADFCTEQCVQVCSFQ